MNIIENLKLNNMAKGKVSKGSVRPKPMSPKAGSKAGKRYGCGGKLKRK